MAAPKWTLGPWRLDAEWGRGAIVSEVITNNESGTDIVCTFDEADMPADEVDANAHLIAAAPELYEALSDARRVVAPEFRPRIDALLAKARGETP